MADSPSIGTPSIGAVVVNFHLAASTVDCVRKLRACGYTGTLRVLVIDNGSGPGDVEVLRAAAAELDFVLDAVDHNAGYCAAVNRGITWAQDAGVELLLLLNNDVAVTPGFLAPLAAVLAAEPRVAAVAPTILWPDGRVWALGARMRFGPNLNVLCGQNGPPPDPRTGPEEVDYLPGACALYRLADLVAAGGVDEDYFMYFEDADLGARLRGRGQRLVWIPWTSVVHDASASSGGGRSPTRKFMTAANSARYLKRHGSPKLWAAFVLFDLLGWPLAMLAGTPPRAAWAKAKGAWSGLFGRRVTAADVR